MHFYSRVTEAWFAACLCLVVALNWPVFSYAGTAEGETVPTMILKVEGDGQPKVRRNIGVEESAGAGGTIFPGDRVITDDRSAVFLILNDGSILKVGISSEFKLEEAEVNERFVSWAFRLLKGSMRALVEKNPNPETRVRIHSPSGTIGVRGTEFVAATDDEAKTTYLYMIEGLVTFGRPGCEKNNSCIEVRGGESASVREGDGGELQPHPFRSQDLFSVKPNEEGRAVPDKSTYSRMSLFQDAKRVSARFKQDLDEDSLRAMVGKATEDLAEAQDRAIGRSKAEREAMHAAVKNGTYEDLISAADAYSEAKGGFEGDTNGGAENMVAQTAAAKFRLGLAVKEALEAGYFGEAALKDGVLDPKKLKDEKFVARKHFNYDQENLAKEKGVTLNGAKEEYEKTLEFAEAFPAESSRSKSDGGSKNKCRKKKCRTTAIVHELKTVSEGVVGAFSGRGRSRAKPSSFSSKSSNKGEIKTKYFEKSIPGNGCFKEEKECTVKPCDDFYKGKKCEKGESLKDCKVKKVPVRCPDGK